MNDWLVETHTEGFDGPPDFVTAGGMAAALAVAFVLIGTPGCWVTLTVAGLALGLMILLITSGLSLVFGLMDVLNFGHSAFVSFGAFIAASVLAALGGRLGSDSVGLAALALLAAFAAAMQFGLAGGWFFETAIPSRSTATTCARSSSQWARRSRLNRRSSRFGAAHPSRCRAPLFANVRW